MAACAKGAAGKSAGEIQNAFPTSGTTAAMYTSALTRGFPLGAWLIARPVAGVDETCNRPASRQRMLAVTASWMNSATRLGWASMTRWEESTSAVVMPARR